MVKNYKRVVVKVGTSTLTFDNGKPNYKKIEHLVRVLSNLENGGMQIVLVSSGAISVGVDRLGLPERPKTIAGKQAAAAVGQCELMFLYDKFFSEYNKVVSQVLMTRDAVDVADRRNNIVNTLSELLLMGVIPIVNENDTVATEEIEFGDNDTLSAMVADCVNADLLAIITDIDGLYDKDPAKNPDAKRIDVVDEITDEILQMAGGSGSNRGTGGMITKLHAAQIAKKKGISTAIVSGENPEILYDLIAGKNVGTIIR